MFRSMGLSGSPHTNTPGVLPPNIAQGLVNEVQNQQAAGPTEPSEDNSGTRESTMLKMVTSPNITEEPHESLQCNGNCGSCKVLRGAPNKFLCRSDSRKPTKPKKQKQKKIGPLSIKEIQKELKDLMKIHKPQLQQPQLEQPQLQLAQLQRPQLQVSQQQQPYLKQFQLQQPQLQRPQMQEPQLKQPHMQNAQLQVTLMQQPQLQQPQLQRPQLQEPQLKQPHMQNAQLQVTLMQQPQLQQPQLQRPQLQVPQRQLPQLPVPQVHQPQLQEPQLQQPHMENAHLQVTQMQQFQLQQPQLQRPQLQVPQRQLHKLQVPQVHKPQLQEPELVQPQRQAPQLQQPELQQPELQRPQQQVPQSHVPQLQVPQVHQPQLEQPQLQVPQLQVPQLQVPQLHVPELQVPQLQVPQLQIPQLQVPQLLQPLLLEDELPAVNHFCHRLEDLMVVTHMKILSKIPVGSAENTELNNIWYPILERMYVSLENCMNQGVAEYIKNMEAAYQLLYSPIEEQTDAQNSNLHGTPNPKPDTSSNEQEQLMTEAAVAVPLAKEQERTGTSVPAVRKEHKYDGHAVTKRNRSSLNLKNLKSNAHVAKLAKDVAIKISNPSKAFATKRKDGTRKSGGKDKTPLIAVISEPKPFKPLKYSGQPRILHSPPKSLENIKLEKFKIYTRISDTQDRIITALDKLYENLMQLRMPTYSNLEKQRQERMAFQFAVRFSRTYLFPLRALIESINGTKTASYHSVSSNEATKRLVITHYLLLKAIASYQRNARFFLMNRVSQKLSALMEIIYRMTNVCLDKGALDRQDPVVECLQHRCLELMGFIEDLQQDRFKVARENYRQYHKKMVNSSYPVLHKHYDLKMFFNDFKLYEPRLVPKENPKKHHRTNATSQHKINQLQAGGEDKQQQQLLDEMSTHIERIHCGEDVSDHGDALSEEKLPELPRFYPPPGSVWEACVFFAKYSVSSFNLVNINRKSS